MRKPAGGARLEKLAQATQKPGGPAGRNTVPINQRGDFPDNKGLEERCRGLDNKQMGKTRLGDQ